MMKSISSGTGMRSLVMKNVMMKKHANYGEENELNDAGNKADDRTGKKWLSQCSEF